MVLLESSEEWQRQSSLLLQARPSTTRIIVKYNVLNPESTKYQKSKKRKATGETAEETTTSSAPATSKAVLTLRTQDPESGVCLKFKTDRAADVGRVVGGLGRLSRHMAALPQKTEDVVMQDKPVSSSGIVDTAETLAPSQANPTASDKVAQPPAGGGAGKKKKKGKK